MYAYYPGVSPSLLFSSRRRRVSLIVLAGLCLFAWWSVQPVGPDCPARTLSSDPYGSVYDPSTARTGGFGDECTADARHPRLYGWLGL